MSLGNNGSVDNSFYRFSLSAFLMKYGIGASFLLFFLHKKILTWLRDFYSPLFSSFLFFSRKKWISPACTWKLFLQASFILPCFHDPQSWNRFSTSELLSPKQITQLFQHKYIQGCVRLRKFGAIMLKKLLTEWYPFSFLIPIFSLLALVNKLSC